MRFLSILLIISFVCVTLIQLPISTVGIMFLFKEHWLPSSFIALALMFIPIVGPLTGVYGAVAVLKWPFFWAFTLFFFPYILYAALIFFGARNFMQKIRTIFHPEPYHPPEIIDAEFTVKEDNPPSLPKD